MQGNGLVLLMVGKYVYDKGYGVMSLRSIITKSKSKSCERNSKYLNIYNNKNAQVIFRFYNFFVSLLTSSVVWRCRHTLYKKEVEGSNPANDNEIAWQRNDNQIVWKEVDD